MKLHASTMEDMAAGQSLWAATQVKWFLTDDTGLGGTGLKKHACLNALRQHVQEAVWVH